MGGSSYKQIWTSAVSRIATPIGAGAIHPISFLPLMRFVAGSAFEKPSLIQLTAMAALSRVAAIHQVELLRSHTNGRFAQAALRGVGQKLAIGWGRECPLTFFFDENPSIILNRDVSRSGKVDGAIADQNY
ncbi:MAG: hypothetical protein ACSHW3_08865 [Sulfitobacter sp.]